MIETLSEKTAPIMEALSNLFQAHPLLATYYTTVVRFVFVILAFFIVFRAIRSLLAAKSPPEVWGYLSLPGGGIKPIVHWENVIGRDKSVDIPVDVMTVSRNHGTLVRNSEGRWFYTDIGSKGGSKINGEPIGIEETVEMAIGDTLTIGGVNCVLMPPSLEERRHNLEIRKARTKPFRPWSALVALTIFQILTVIQFIAADGSSFPFTALLCFLLFTVSMWVYCGFVRSMGQIAFEMEIIAFFLCTINLAVMATSDPDGVFKQFVAILLGMILFVAMCWYLRDLRRALGIRRLLVVLSALLLLINIVFGTSKFGSVNWVYVGSYSLQPSELVKIAYIFIGAGTLDELYKRKNLMLFLGFSVFCLGCLAIMNDFGTAIIFFVTFVVISYLRSGELSKLSLIVGVCAVGALMLVRFVPHISERFATWGHIWDYPDAGGYQQVRGLAAAASGGCFGLGAGDGWFHNIVAANTDLVWPLVCEEWGLIIGLLVLFCLIALGVFAVRSIQFGRSTFFTITACASTSLIIFQTMLNVLGSLDILPFTGVTLPFISAGGTSMLTSWGLLAFLKAADTRQNASLAVRSLGAAQENAFATELDDDSFEEDRPPEKRRGRSSDYEPDEPAGTRRTHRRSSRNRSDNMREAADNVKEWLELDADVGRRSGTAGRKSSRSGSHASRSSGGSRKGSGGRSSRSRKGGSDK